jgi:EmrB/QacA subfamily drug resistance transporter
MALPKPIVSPKSFDPKRLLPWLVAVAFFMESLDTTILNTAVPAMAAALHIVPLSTKSVLSSYTLSVAVFVPVSGWMADRFGTRRVFSTAIGLFIMGSLLCGLSTDIHQLVAFRVLQGLGGAMMVPVGRLTLVRTFPKNELVRAMSFVAVPALIGPMLGPVVGGFIVHYFTWRMIFFVNLPIGITGFLCVLRYLPDYRAKRSDPLDWIGLVLFSTGVALLSYVLEVFGEHSLPTTWIVGLLLVSILLLTTYAIHASKKATPLLQLALFKIRTFRVAVGGSFITRLGAGGVPFLLPLLYQSGLGFTPVQSALLIIPQPIAAMSLKFVLPQILSRFGYRNVLIFNTITMGGSIALFSTIGITTPIWMIVIQAFVFGFGSSLQYSSMNTLVYADMQDRQTSMASTMSSTMQQMSLSFGVAAASLSAAFFIPDRYNSSTVELIHGIHLAFIVLGAFTVISALLFYTLKQTDGSAISMKEAAQPI